MTVELSTLGSVIKAAYEAEADTNAFTDLEKAKLAAIEALADVTDTANVTAAGALMDSEVTNLAAVKAFDPADYATAAQGATADTALQPGDNISTLTNDAGFTDDTAADAAQADATAAKTKTDFLTVTQPVDLDTIESRVNELDAAVVLKGEWDASAGTFPGSGSAQAGWSYIVSVGGTVDGEVFVANDRIVAITDNASTATYAANWLKLDYTDAVLSVAGLTGAVSAANLRTAINVEDGADVTDTTNVTAAGALMDSEVTNLAAVKAFDPADYATAAQGVTADGAIPKSLIDAAGDLIVGSADNTPVRFAMGTALQQIRVNAGGTALEYFTPSGGSGDFLADGSVPMTGAFSTNVGTFTSGVADGASSVAYDYNTANTLATSGALHRRSRNNGTLIESLSKDGHLFAAAGATFGASNTNAGTRCLVVGLSNNISTFNSSDSLVVGQSNTLTNPDRMIVVGNGHNVTDASYNADGAVFGYRAKPFAQCSMFIGAGGASAGDQQAGVIALQGSTINATPANLLAGGQGISVPADTTIGFIAIVTGRSNEADGNDSAVYEIKGCISRDESNNTALVGSVTKTVISESAGATAWDADAIADDTSELLAIQVTGEAGTTIKWSGTVTLAAVTLA